jgi:hypothetical protein
MQVTAAIAAITRSNCTFCGTCSTGHAPSHLHTSCTPTTPSLFPSLHSTSPHPLPPIYTQVCLAFLKNLSHKGFKEQQVKGGDKIDLGRGHVVEFVMAPNLHWPDTMFSYDHGTGIMYTCDAFGMHYCSEDPFDSDIKAVLPHYRWGQGRGACCHADACRAATCYADICMHGQLKQFPAGNSQLKAWPGCWAAPAPGCYLPACGLPGISGL